MSQSKEASRHVSNAILWVGGLSMLLVLYVFAYPIVLFGLQSAFSITDVEIIEAFVTFTSIPLQWLYDEVALYTSYCDFWADVFGG